MDIAGGQIQGARRRQEDAFAIEMLADGARLVLVADGLGINLRNPVAIDE